MAQDLFNSLRNHINKISGGEKSPAEMAASVKTAVSGWLEDGGEAIKERIESEIEAAAERRGFVRQDELDLQLKLLSEKIADLELKINSAIPVKKAVRKSAAEKVTSVKKLKSKKVKE